MRLRATWAMQCKILTQKTEKLECWKLGALRSRAQKVQGLGHPRHRDGTLDFGMSCRGAEEAGLVPA